MVPTALIILPFLATFVLCSWQYYRIDPERRLFNARAGLMITSTIGAFGYPLYVYAYPSAWLMSWLIFGVAILWLGLAYHLLRSMPPREND